MLRGTQPCVSSNTVTKRILCSAARRNVATSFTVTIKGLSCCRPALNPGSRFTRSGLRGVRFRPRLAFDFGTTSEKTISMSADAVTAVSHPIFPAPRGASDPIQTYQAYQRAIRHRDLDAVLAVMTEEGKQGMLEFCAVAESAPLFELWCDSQHVPTIVTGCTIQNDTAIVDVRSWQTGGRITMRRCGLVWRIHSEKHWPLP